MMVVMVVVVVVVMMVVVMMVARVGPRSGRGKGNNRDQKHRRENFVHHILLSPLRLGSVANCVGI